MFLGEKTISRLGCFGCHNIPGFENAKPIGTPLNGWGIKSPTKLDFAHIAEYLDDQPIDETRARDGTDLYYQEKLDEHTRSGFLYQKLHRPRSYDYRKTNEDIKAWDDRLRMPQFAWANDPAAVEEVMTFVLGLTGEKIAGQVPAEAHYSPRRTRVAAGEQAPEPVQLHRLPRPGHAQVHDRRRARKLDEAMPDLDDQRPASPTATGRTTTSRSSTPDLTYDPKKPARAEARRPARAVTIEGMPIGLRGRA